MAVIQNKIVNGGFEAGLSSWISQNVTVVQTPANEGFSAALLQGGALNSFLIQSVQAGPGDTFELMFSIARDTAGTTSTVSVSIAYFSATNAFLGYGLVENVRVPDAAVRVYQLVDGVASPAPAGTVRAQLAVTRLAATGTAGVFVDQIVLKQVIADASGAVPILFPNVPTASQQTDSLFFMPHFPETRSLLSLDVTTTQPNQRVLIDAFIETEFFSGASSAVVLGVTYTLKRDGQTVLSITPGELLTVSNTPGFAVQLDHLIYPNMTIIDVVPNPGTHAYTIEGAVSPSVAIGDEVIIRTRAINAMVFPPGAGCTCA